MTEPIDELEKLVGTLNEEAYEKTMAVGRPIEPFMLRANGIGQAITIFDISIWDSEDDGRGLILNDAGGEQLQSMESFLRGEAKEMIKIINNIKFKKRKKK